jgi:FtsH-binding integral membrane protein
MTGPSPDVRPLLTRGSVTSALGVGLLASSALGLWASQSYDGEAMASYQVAGVLACLTFALAIAAAVRRAWARWLFVIVAALSAVTASETLLADHSLGTPDPWGLALIQFPTLAVAALAALIAGATARPRSTDPAQK